jgi:hypothetical protein
MKINNFTGLSGSKGKGKKNIGANSGSAGKGKR